MDKTFNSWFGDSEEAKRLYAQESLLVDTSEDFLALIEDKGVKKSKLAKLMGKTKSFVTQSLNGTRNLTLRTLADMAYVIDFKVVVTFEPMNKEAEGDVEIETPVQISEVVAIPNLVKDTGSAIGEVKVLDIFAHNENFEYKEAV